VYAALRTDRACLSFVVRGFIATPSMVCAGSSYSTYANRKKDHRTLPLNRSAHPGCRTHRVLGLSEVDAQLNIGHGDSGRGPKNHLDRLLGPALSPRRRLATIDHPATSLGPRRRKCGRPNAIFFQKNSRNHGRFFQKTESNLSRQHRLERDDLIVVANVCW
jgi:hypothetical protein